MRTVKNAKTKLEIQGAKMYVLRPMYFYNLSSALVHVKYNKILRVTATT